MRAPGPHPDSKRSRRAGGRHRHRHRKGLPEGWPDHQKPRLPARITCHRRQHGRRNRHDKVPRAVSSARYSINIYRQSKENPLTDPGRGVLKYITAAVTGRKACTVISAQSIVPLGSKKDRAKQAADFRACFSYLL